MKKIGIKKNIYKRTFLAFFAAYLVLVGGFSLFLLNRQQEIESVQFSSLALQRAQMVENTLRQYMNSRGDFRDLEQAKRDLDRELSASFSFGTEMAIYSRDYQLIYNTTDDWLCSYTASRAGPTTYTGYGRLDPRDWFDETEAAELETYLHAVPRAKKPGDLTSYSLSLEGFWVEGDRIIPEKIRVTAMYASQFDEKGKVTGSGGYPEEGVVYLADYSKANQEALQELPHYDNGTIWSINRKTPQAAALREMVLDRERLSQAVSQTMVRTQERVAPMTYRFYQLVPYQSTIKTEAGNSKGYYSELWSVFALEVNLWDQCAGTLLFVWGSCFLTFLITAWILARQTYGLYEKREALERQRIETANALAHDLKTPLSIISGYAQNLMENIQTEKREHYAAQIHTNVERMDQLLRSMLELSGLESGSLQLKDEPVALEAVCTKLINRYGPVCRERQIEVCLEGKGIVTADFALIERVIDNFFVNALEWTPQGGSIQMHVEEKGLEFYNSGSQLPEEALTRIWLPYQKVEAARGETRGTGLGLSIARTILEQYRFSYGAGNREEGIVFWFRQ